MNPPVPREVLFELCAHLAADPSRVNRIVITPDTVEVVHAHSIVDTKPDAAEGS